MIHMDWSWSWTPIGNTAAFGDNPFFDWVRVLCVLGGMALICAIGRILVEARRRPGKMPVTQISRFASLALADLSISLTEVAVAGTPATPRLVCNVLVMVTGVYGVWGMRQKQRKNPPPR